MTRYLYKQYQSITQQYPVVPRFERADTPRAGVPQPLSAADKKLLETMIAYAEKFGSKKNEMIVKMFENLSIIKGFKDDNYKNISVLRDPFLRRVNSSDPKIANAAFKALSEIDIPFDLSSSTEKANTLRTMLNKSTSYDMYLSTDSQEFISAETGGYNSAKEDGVTYKLIDGVVFYNKNGNIEVSTRVRHQDGHYFFYKADKNGDIYAYEYIKNRNGSLERPDLSKVDFDSLPRGYESTISDENTNIDVRVADVNGSKILCYKVVGADVDGSDIEPAVAEVHSAQGWYVTLDNLGMLQIIRDRNPVMTIPANSLTETERQSVSFIDKETTGASNPLSNPVNKSAGTVNHVG